MAALFAGPRWPWAGDWQWAIGPDTDNAHYHNLNEVSTTGNVSPYLNGGSAKTTKTLIVTSQSQPAESGASWSHQWPGCRAAAVGNVGNVGCFPNWAAEQNTEHRTDLSRTKTKGCPGSGRGEGASSSQQQGWEKCLTHSRSFQQQAKYFSVWLRWKMNLDFRKKIPHVLKYRIRWVVNDNGWW